MPSPIVKPLEVSDTSFPFVPISPTLDRVGKLVGATVGFGVGTAVGWDVGIGDGALVGIGVGIGVGRTVGVGEGP